MPRRWQVAGSPGLGTDREAGGAALLGAPVEDPARRGIAFAGECGVHTELGQYERRGEAGASPLTNLASEAVTRVRARDADYFSCSQYSAGMSWAIFRAPFAPP